MQKLKNNLHACSAIAFIDYKPAELRINRQILVVYYAKHPINHEFERFRVTVPKLKSRKEQIKHGKKIELEINKKLDSGWLPYYSNKKTNEFKTFEFCATKLIEQTRKEVEKNDKRPDTLRAYTSYLNMINTYVKQKNIKLNLVFEFNFDFAIDYLDWIYFERENSARTFNNHLQFMTTFVKFCIRHGYLKEDFTNHIQQKDKGEKIRKIIPSNEKEILKTILIENPNYFALCMLTYFCFVRRTEITKLKVSDVNLQAGYIVLSSQISKNKKTESVTIPNNYLPILANHIADANSNDYLFSSNNFGPGIIQLDPKKISDTWAIIRAKNNIAKESQFYSLKDTGITDLLETGMPAIKVRDQARHHDLRITESYTNRNKTCDEFVRNSKLSF